MDAERLTSFESFQAAQEELNQTRSTTQALCQACAAAAKDLRSAILCQDRMKVQKEKAAERAAERASKRHVADVRNEREAPAAKKAKTGGGAPASKELPIFLFGGSCGVAVTQMKCDLAVPPGEAEVLAKHPLLFTKSDGVEQLMTWPQ